MELVRLHSKAYSAYQVENILAMIRSFVDGLGLIPPVFECSHMGDIWIVSTDHSHMAHALRTAMNELTKFDLCPICGAEHPRIACPLSEIT